MSEAAKLGAGGASRIGVIGVGVRGSNHARVLSELSGVKLVGVVDPDRKSREHVARHVERPSAGRSRPHRDHQSRDQSGDPPP